jgi:hypothetical protein
MRATTGSRLPDRDAPPRLAEYEEERARYRVEAPERFKAVTHVVDRWAAEEPAGARCSHPTTAAR